VEIIKGGTGKSTTAAEVGIHLALQGLKVLLIDLDHQANLTQLMGYEADLEPADAVGQEMSIDGIVQGTFEQFIDLVLAGDREPRVPAEECAGFIKRPFGEHGPAVIPADTFLADVESEIAAYRGNRESVFKDIFQKSREGKIPGFNVDDFDAVIFDCPPSISFTSINAVAMADFIVAPVKMDSFTVKGLSRLVTEINRQRRQDPLYQPELIILPTYYQGGVKRVGRMHDRLQSYKDFLSDISIGQNEDFPKSTEKYLPLSLQKPNCAGAMEYQAFARSLAERIAVRGQKVRGAK
jgi:cellulose biosynthesis protein BcsQ